MFDKIKKWLTAAAAAAIGFLAVLLHVKQRKIDTLNSEVEKAKANSNVQKDSAELLAQQLEKERLLDETKESYNSIVDSFNNRADM